MRRSLLALSTLAVALSASAAQAVPSVTGGGFTRDGHGRNATKTTLALEARPSTNSGNATYTVQKPGARASSVHIRITCVKVDGNTAYASGEDSAGDPWYLKVVDNGEPGRADQFGVSREGDSLLGLIPMPELLASNCNANDVATRVISGGNFQVSPA